MLRKAMLLWLHGSIPGGRVGKGALWHVRLEQPELQADLDITSRRTGLFRQGHISKYAMLVFILAIVCMLGLLHFKLTKSASGTYRPFALLAVREPDKPEWITYGDQTAKAFDTYLKSQGFHIEELPVGFILPFSWTGLPAGEDNWYVSEDEQWRSIFILMRVPKESMSGAYVLVTWQARGYHLYLEKIDSQAQQLAMKLSAWWEQYEKENPQPWKKGRK